MSTILLELKDTVSKAISENSISFSKGNLILRNIENIINQYSKLSEHEQETYIRLMKDSINEAINDVAAVKKIDLFFIFPVFIIILIFCNT